MSDFERMNFKYEYPNGLNFKPGSELHDKIVKMVMQKAIESRKRMEPRFDAWKKIDRTLTAYVPLDEEELRVKSQDSRKPVSIVIPLSYATLETLLTYQAAAFLESPIFR